jgi:hypothetical protein
LKFPDAAWETFRRFELGLAGAKSIVKGIVRGIVKGIVRGIVKGIVKIIVKSIVKGTVKSVIGDGTTASPNEAYRAARRDEPVSVASHFEHQHQR